MKFIASMMMLSGLMLLPIALIVSKKQKAFLIIGGIGVILLVIGGVLLQT